MKTKDLEIGGLYSIVDYDGATPKKVRVVEVGLHRQVFLEYRYHTSDKADGVNVEYLSGDLEGTKRIIQNREIKRTWIEQEKLNLITENKAREKEEGLSRGNDIVKELNIILGTDIPMFKGRWSTTFRKMMVPTANLTLSDLEELLDRVEVVLDIK